MESLCQVCLYDDVEDLRHKRSPWLSDPEAMVNVPLFVLAQTALKLSAQHKYLALEGGATEPLSTWCARPCWKHLRRELRARQCDLTEVQSLGLLDQLEMIAGYNEMPALRQRIQDFRDSQSQKAQRCRNCSLWLNPVLASQIECSFSPVKYVLMNTVLCSRCHGFLCNCRITTAMHVFETATESGSWPR